jgi:hypothetical protein
MVAVLVVGLGLLIFGIRIYNRSMDRRWLAMRVEPAHMVVGQRLSWRELYKHPTAFKSLGSARDMFVSDFDADQEDEVLLIQYTGQGDLLELDGTRTAVRIGGDAPFASALCWDYDHDGRSEIVETTPISDIVAVMQSEGAETDQATASPSLPVYNLQGQRFGSVPGNTDGPLDMLLADVDGDGFNELLAPVAAAAGRQSQTDFCAYGLNGRLIWRLQVECPALAAGDIDGDGQDEIVCYRTGPYGALSLGMNQQPTQLPAWPPYGRPRLGYEFDGDGQEDLVCEDCGPVTGIIRLIYNPATAQHDVLDNSFAPPGSAVTYGQEYCAGKFMPSGLTSLVMRYEMGGHLTVYAASGKCVYCEQFGDIVSGAAIAQAKGQDHLVVQLSDRLLIYP